MVPYGYKIVNGSAAVDEPAQKKIQLLFQNYLAGMSLSKAANEAGIHIPHGMVGKMLVNQRYRKYRAEKLGRTNLKKPTVQKTVPTAFTLAKIEEYYDDPARQAEYLYSLIQEEVE